MFKPENNSLMTLNRKEWYFHMAILQELMDIMRKGPEVVGKVNDIKLNTKSITRSAKDSTWQFPCLITDTVPIDLANTVRSTLDKVYATYAQSVLSMNNMFDITIDPTPVSYLKRIHQNLAIESANDHFLTKIVNDLNDLTIDDENVDEYMEKVYDGSYRLYMNKDQNFGVIINENSDDIKSLINANKELSREYLSDFDLTPVEVFEADSDYTSRGDMISSMLDGARKNAEDQKRYDRQKDIVAASAKGKAPQISDRDIKRSNDIVPLGIEVRLVAVNDKKEFVQFIDVVIGIKTYLHLVKSDDMVENIVRALQNKSILFKFLRWTTGELSFVKDILLNINDLKMDATATGKRTPFFGYLKKLKNRKITVRNLTVPTAVLPNSTIVITPYEAEYILNNYGIDLYDDRTAVKLLDALFLIGFIIIDEGSNTMRAIYDGDKSFQMFSMDALERENSMTQNKLSKEIGRMISK